MRAQVDGASETPRIFIPALRQRAGIFLFGSSPPRDEMSKPDAKAVGSAARRDPEIRAGTDRSVAEEKWIYLRTVYPANPGIPHYLDFPQG